MIKVIIERCIAEGMESTYDEEIRKTLGAIVGTQGYISGSTFSDVHQANRRITITNWRDLSAWQSWYKSEKRRELNGVIQLILQQEEKINVLQTHILGDATA